jgi:catechol 2,3-dioxygenase-like lactoylglutathione lyase family enzyme
LAVTEIARSREFYTQLLGLEVTGESRSSCFMTCGDQFVALFRSAEPGLDHYCYSVENYGVDRAAETLRGQGLEPRIRGNRIYFDDPDGIEVQLSSPEHRA